MSPENGAEEPADPIGEAVTKTEAKSVEVRMYQQQMTLGTTGRPFVVAVPLDATTVELLDIIHWIASPEEGGLADRLFHARGEQHQPKLAIARSMPSDLPQ